MVKLIPVWNFVFNEIHDQGRKIDITEEIVKTGDVIVYVEIDFYDASDGKKKVGLSGRFHAAEVKQMLAPYPGLAKRSRAILIEKAEITDEIKKKVDEMIKKLDKEGGYLPKPAPLA